MVAKVIPILTARQARELWENSRDSIRHALKHFAELSAKSKDEDHHKKWIILSIHHAAEAFCNMLLKQFDPANTLFKRGDEDWWPSLPTTIRELLTPKFQPRLTGSERRLLDLLKGLNDSRNRIMHGITPENLDLSLTAMSILGLSRVAYRRKGESVDDILKADPPIQRDVIKAISYKKLDDYYRFVEAFLTEELPDRYIPECENCGASAVVNNRCEACFESMDSFTCASCDEEFLLPESFRLQTHAEIVCPSCGEKISV
jgi:DNA-directed RNA polymerase subunit RPC12/RpoP